MAVELTASLARLDLAPDQVGAGADAGADAPEWVHLMPAGDFAGRDGRRFRLGDPEAVVAASLRPGVDLVVDYEHQTEAQAELKSGPIPAAGWITALEVRASGLWGKVEWTALARELIAAKAYRYLSPVIRYTPQDREVRRLTGAGLVHNPNLELTALSREEPPVPHTTPDPKPETKPDPATRLLAALGLTEDAEDGAIRESFLALLGRLTAFLDQAEGAAPAKDAPDPAEYAPTAAMRELLAERNTALATMGERAAENRVGEALAAGYITPAMRPWALALCREKPESFETFLAAGAPAYGHLLRPAGPGGLAPRSPDAAVLASPEARAICRQLALDPAALAG